MKPTPAEARIRRDNEALRRLLAGEPQVQVAAKAGISQVQLWRRLGARLKALRAAQGQGQGQGQGRAAVAG